MEKIVEKIIEVEKQTDPQETSMYKPASTSEAPPNKPKPPPPNTSWGSPGGVR